MDDPTRSLLGSAPPEPPAEPPGDTHPSVPSSFGATSRAAELAGHRGAQSPDDGSGASDGSSGGASDGASGGNRPSADPKFIGDAMRSLYRSSESSIERGDATRVISRFEPVESVRAPRPTPRSVRPTPQPRPISSAPPGPRVDVTLWIVLALGLFAIAGVMLSAAL